MTESEIDLVGGAKRGDREAFSRLIDRDYPLAFGLALCHLNNEQDANDVVQETYFKAWQALDGFKEECRFSTWRHAIETNCIRDWHRRNAGRREREAPLDAREDDGRGPLQVPDPLPGPEALAEAGLEKERLKAEIRKALDMMGNPAYRVLVILWDLHGLSHDDLIGTLGLLAEAGERAYRESLPSREGLGRDELSRLFEELRASRGAFDMKVKHARAQLARQLLRMRTP